MRIRAIAGGVVASAAVLTIGWQVGAAQVTASSVAGSSGSGTSGGSSGSGSSGSGSTSSGSSGTSAGGTATTPSPTPSSSGTSGSSKATGTSGTFAGTTAQTEFGPVQVEIVVSSGKITDVKALQLTDQGGRSVEISNYAAPVLRTEALSAQSAKIQSVSGATYTSEGYVTSLQSALDKAGL